MTKAVIGGGITGLIWCFYNPDYTLFSEQIGGQLGDPWMGPRLLHRNFYNSKLLKDLSLPCIEEINTIGYYIDGSVQSSCSSEKRIEYFRKSRCLSNSDEVPDSVMSGGENVIHHYKVDWEEVLSRLSFKSPHISENVSRIEVKENGLLLNGRYEVEELVWTPPLPILFKLLGLPCEFESLDKLFIKRDEFRDFDFGDYDYVYIPGPELPYHRVTKVNGSYVVEWTGRNLAELTSRKVKPSPRRRLLKGAQLVPLKVDPYSLGLSPQIKLLGRMAEWNHKLKIEDVVERSIAAKESQ